jgi:PAS domain S-box-containing protein
MFLGAVSERRKMRFRTKFTFLSGGLILFIAVVITSFVYYSLVSTVELQIKSSLEKLAHNVVDETDRVLYERHSDLKIIATDAILTSPSSTRKQITERLLVFRNTYKSYISFSFYTLERVRIADTSGLLLNTQDPMSPHWEEVLQGKMSSASDVAMSPSLRIPVIYFASPVRNSGGETVGYVVARIPVFKLYEVVEKVSGVYGGDENIEVGVADKRGIRIFSNHDRGTILTDTIYNWDAIQKLLAGRNVGTIMHEHESGEKYICALARERGYADFRGNGWTLAIHVPQKLAFASAVALRNKLAAIFIAIVIFTMVVISFFARTVSNPITKLRDFAFKVGEGKWDERLEVTTRDEIGDLAQSFNQMVGNLKNITASRDVLEKEIAERTQAEERVKEARDFLENVFRTSLDGIMVIGHKGVIKMANTAGERILGYLPGELIGKSVLVLSPEGEGREKGFEVMTQLSEAGSVSNVEMVWVKRDGSLVDIELTAALLKDSQGNREGAVSVVRDISERKRFDELLKKSEEKYHSLIENASDAIIAVDKEGVIIEFNKKAKEMFGYAREEALGSHITLLSPPSERARQKSMLEEFRKTKELYIVGKTQEGKGLRKDGQEFPFEGSAFGVEIAGERILTVILRDVSERKKMEQQLLQAEKLKSLGELAGGVAHDFNNVLAAILGRAQLLRMIVKSPWEGEERRKSIQELEEGLEIIEIASRDGAETVRRIQKFTRKRDDDTHQVVIDIHEVIEHAIEFTRTKWKTEAAAKGITITVHKEFSPLPCLLGSPSELREVFTNLISNAVDAMPHGGAITVKTFEEDRHIIVRIADTGVGVPKNIQQRVFDPFFTTKGPQSTGLGLSVSYGIISRHRGTISVESSEGKGTTFTIKLPVDEMEHRKEEKKMVPSSEARRKAKILIIDDEEQVRTLLSDILLRDGHEVEVAASGKAGIELFEKQEFDLVFTDLGMQGMSGWQVAEKIKSLNGRVPVALITGWNVDLSRAEMKENWVDLVVHKPFEIDQVLKLVQEGMILRERFKSV